MTTDRRRAIDLIRRGYAATSGDEWMRRDLAEQAMRLGWMLAGLMPHEPEVNGLVALMALQRLAPSPVHRRPPRWPRRSNGCAPPPAAGWWRLYARRSTGRSLHRSAEGGRLAVKKTVLVTA
jgi:hypothetical protein